MCHIGRIQIAYLEKTPTCSMPLRNNCVACGTACCNESPVHKMIVDLSAEPEHTYQKGVKPWRTVPVKPYLNILVSSNGVPGLSNRFGNRSFGPFRQWILFFRVDQEPLE